LIGSLYQVMGATLWRGVGPGGALPSGLGSDPARFARRAYAEPGLQQSYAATPAANPFEVAQRARAQWSRGADARHRGRLLKCVSALYAGLEARGFPRLADELGKGARGEGSSGSKRGGGRDGFFSVELTGPAEVCAALEARGDPDFAANVLLASPAMLRRALLLETKLRAQDALCATALGPAAAAHAATQAGAGEAGAGEAAAAPEGGTEPLHFAWLERVLRRHPEVSAWRLGLFVLWQQRLEELRLGAFCEFAGSAVCLVR
jgi:hypothetical protein